MLNKCVYDIYRQSGLQPVFKSIWGSLATVSGSLVVDGSEALVSRSSEKEKMKKRTQDESPTRPSVFSVSLIQDLVSRMT